MGFFSGIGDILFGAKPSSKTTQESVLTEGQKQILSVLETQGLNAAKGGDLFGFDTFEGASSAPANKEQLTSLAALEEQALAGVNDPISGASDDALLSFLQGEKTGQNNFESFFESNIRDPLLSQFNEEILPGIERSFRGANTFSTDRTDNVGRANRDIINSLTAAFDRGTREERALNIETLLKSIELEQSRGENRREGINDLFKSASVLREQDQQALNADFSNFIAQQNLKGQELNQLLSLLGARSFENIVLNKPGTTGLLQAFLSGGGLSNSSPTSSHTNTGTTSGTISV